MAREPRALIFVGIKDGVIALDRRDGSEIWRQSLSGSGIITVLWDGEALLAAADGEVFRLHPETGVPMWHNPLKGRGTGLATLASTHAPSPLPTPYETIAEQQRREAAATAASLG